MQIQNRTSRRNQYSQLKQMNKCNIIQYLWTIGKFDLNEFFFLALKCHKTNTITGCSAAEIGKISLVFQVDELQLSCLFLNPGFQPATSTDLFRCACHLPLVNLRPTSWQHKKTFSTHVLFKGYGTLFCLVLLLALHSVFSIPGTHWLWRIRGNLDFPKHQVLFGRM